MIDLLIKLVEDKSPIATIQAQYELIATLNCRIRKAVEKHLAKGRAGRVPWSPELQAIMDRRQLWTNLVKLKLGILISNKKIRRQIDRCKVSNGWTSSLEEAKQELEKAWKEWKIAKKKAHKLRKQFLKDCSKPGPRSMAPLLKLKRPS